MFTVWVQQLPATSPSVNGNIDKGKDLFSIHDGKDSTRSYQRIAFALSLFGYCERSKAAQIYCPHTFTRQSSFSSEYVYGLIDTNTDFLS